MIYVKNVGRCCCSCHTPISWSACGRNTIGACRSSSIRTDKAHVDIGKENAPAPSSAFSRFGQLPFSKRFFLHAKGGDGLYFHTAQRFGCPLGVAQYRYSGRLSSRRVLMLWWRWQSGCQLDSSQKSLLSPRCGMMWSTSVALTHLPSFMHSTHIGCAAR